MTEQNPATEDLKRTIVLIYGVVDNSNPFWVFAAVKPSKYQAFHAAYMVGKLDIHKFGEFGEILVCGDGKGPPDDVTLKVAEMYQTDAQTLMKAMVSEPAPDNK